MGFFKKLKEKIFSLRSKEDKEEKKENILKISDDSAEQDKKKKIELKILKKEEKQRNKRLKKEKKLDKYIAGLSKSGINLTTKIIELQNRHNEINEEFFEELEEILIMSDISVNMVQVIIEEIKKEVRNQNVEDRNLINEIIIDKMFAIYSNQSIVNTELKLNHEGLNVLMVVGVNGVGKTTTIAKLVNKYQNLGKKVIVAAGDTFRAGAVEQLRIWAERLGAGITLPEKEEQDPSSVVFKSIKEAKEGDYDLLIVDTAGRLHNKVNLMNELAKMKKIIEREIPNAPHETLLVLDATSGQNGINQAKVFKDVTNISGIILTKMDGTSNGGIILSIKDLLDIDVKLIGLGEKIDDLEEFDLDSYIYGLVNKLMVEESYQ
ncbi:MAG: signal recognition particle-docking protein FtsY [Metamycoplasmataceae bacterium]